MTIPFRSESIISADPSYTSVISVDSEGTSVDSTPAVQTLRRVRVGAPQANRSPQKETASTEKIYRIDQQPTRLAPDPGKLSRGIFASVKSKLAEQTVHVDSIKIESQRNRLLDQPSVVTTDSIDLTCLDLTDAAIDKQSVSSTDAIAELSWYTTSLVYAPVNQQTGNLQTAEVVGDTKQSEEYQQAKAVESGADPIDISILQPATGEKVRSVGVNSIRKMVESPVTVRPAWEVPEFRWSKVTQHLRTHHKSAFLKLLSTLDLEQHSHPVISVLNTRSGQGATTLATCLATILTEDQSALLIDCDFDSPGVDKAANFRIDSGWESLESFEKINEVLVRSVSNGLTVMPMVATGLLESGTVDSDYREAMLKRVSEWAETLRCCYDYVIIDTGHYRNISNHRNSDWIDVAVIVSDETVSGENKASVDAYHELTRSGIKSVVIAENFRINRSNAA